MRFIRQVRLVDALAAWGAHEAAGRWRMSIHLDTQDAKQALDGVEVALLARSPLLGRLLSIWPWRIDQVELAIEDAPGLLLPDGTRLVDWAKGIQEGNDEAAGHVRALVMGGTPVEGPVFCCVQRDIQGGMGMVSGPCIVLDGWHRLAAWQEHQALGREYPIPGYVASTVMPFPCMDQVSATSAHGTREVESVLG